jgi:hypothetical protein
MLKSARAFAWSLEAIGQYRIAVLRTKLFTKLYNSTFMAKDMMLPKNTSGRIRWLPING